MKNKVEQSQNPSFYIKNNKKLINFLKKEIMILKKL